MIKRSGWCSLADYLGDVVRLVCQPCHRRGQYSKAELIRRCGADMALPDLLVQIARCDRRDLTSCGAHYLDLVRKKPAVGKSQSTNRTRRRSTR
jgi:hypothetical protein